MFKKLILALTLLCAHNASYSNPLAATVQYYICAKCVKCICPEQTELIKCCDSCSDCHYKIATCSLCCSLGLGSCALCVGVVKVAFDSVPKPGRMQR